MELTQAVPQTDILDVTAQRSSPKPLFHAIHIVWEDKTAMLEILESIAKKRGGDDLLKMSSGNKFCFTQGPSRAGKARQFG